MGRLGRTIVYIIGGGLLTAIVVAWMVGQYNPEWDYIWPGKRAAALKVRSCIEKETFEYNGNRYHFINDAHFFITSDSRGKKGITVNMFNFIETNPIFAASLPRIKKCHPSFKFMWMPAIVEQGFMEALRKQSSSQ
jgi:hypothetical protein